MGLSPRERTAGLVLIGILLTVVTRWPLFVANEYLLAIQLRNELLSEKADAAVRLAQPMCAHPNMRNYERQNCATDASLRDENLVFGVARKYISRRQLCNDINCSGLWYAVAAVLCIALYYGAMLVAKSFAMRYQQQSGMPGASYMIDDMAQTGFYKPQKGGKRGAEDDADRAVRSLSDDLFADGYVGTRRR